MVTALARTAAPYLAGAMVGKALTGDNGKAGRRDVQPGKAMIQVVKATNNRDVLIAAMSNPLVVLFAGVVAASLLEKSEILDAAWADVLKKGTVSVAALQAIAPVLAGGSTIESLATLGLAGGLGLSSGASPSGVSGFVGKNISDAMQFFANPSAKTFWDALWPG